MNNKTKKLTDHNDEYKKILLTRGYLLTNDNGNIDLSVFPFYNNWKKTNFGNFKLLTHNELNYSWIKTLQDEILLIIGHAYNPFDSKYKEIELLEKYNNLTSLSEKEDYFNEWTGIFTFVKIKDNNVIVYSDASGMQNNVYHYEQGVLWLSTHSQLIQFFTKEVEKDYLIKMKKYKHWNLYGNFMPGDLTAYTNIYRIVPNIKFTFDFDNKTHELNRFYPAEEYSINANYSETIDIISKLLKNSLFLISNKWKTPSISLTGGMDSKTTLASASDVYDKFNYYSFDSIVNDKPDVQAASRICENLKLSHRIDEISDNGINNEKLDDIKQVLMYNDSFIGEIKQNELLKTLYYTNNEDISVEVKSWVNEIARANYYKKFKTKKMPKNLNSKQMTTMYKVFTYNRVSKMKTQNIFKEYIKKTSFHDLLGYDSSDLYLWEFRFSSWGGQVLTSNHRIAHEITIPYNNRKLLDLMLRTPLEKRINDQMHLDLIKKNNVDLYNLNINITNYNETKKRAFFEKIYYKINSFIPF